MIEGHIESLSSDATLYGWVRDTGAFTPCHVQVLYAGAVVAEAIATEFRADLLRAGHGHGHYGFAARLRCILPPGPCSLALHLPAHARTAPMALIVPHLTPPPPVPVETLLATPKTWTLADLLAAPACLDPAGNFGRMGAPRFVDGMYRFVLGRWPSKAEVRLHTQNLDRGRVTPEEFLADMLISRERADLPAELPSPFDPAFPFSFA